MTKKAVEPQFKWINPDGTPTQYFAELIQDMQSKTLSKPVSKTEPTNNQVLIYLSATGLYTPGTN